jgi:EpsI family protein
MDHLPAWNLDENASVRGHILKNLTIRVWMTAALMCFGWLGTAWVRASNAIEVNPLRQSLDSFPMELEGYQATEVPLDDHVREVLNADAVMNRVYRRPDGTGMMCHVSAWLRPESVSLKGNAPHIPKLCYTNSGWTIIGEKATEIETPSGRLKMNLLLVERGTDRSVVAYWYQFGASTFTTPAESRRIHQQFWGKKHWPPLIKVLLDTPAQDIETALPRIEKFAKSAFRWTNEL